MGLKFNYKKFKRVIGTNIISTRHPESNPNLEWIGYCTNSIENASWGKLCSRYNWTVDIGIHEYEFKVSKPIILNNNFNDIITFTVGRHQKNIKPFPFSDVIWTVPLIKTQVLNIKKIHSFKEKCFLTEWFCVCRENLSNHEQFELDSQWYEKGVKMFYE